MKPVRGAQRKIEIVHIQNNFEEACNILRGACSIIA